MKNRACPVNHDDIFRAFGANRVRHARPELPRRRCCCRDDCRRRRRIASPAAATLLGCRTKSFQRVPAKKTSRPIARHRSGAASSFPVHRRTSGATNPPQRCLPEHSADARGNLSPYDANMRAADHCFGHRPIRARIPSSRRTNSPKHPR